MTIARLALGLLAAGSLLSACNSDEATGAENHTPVRLDLAVNGTAMPDDTLRLHTGQTDTVRITFWNSDDENLDVAEDEHYSALTFAPATGLGVTLDTTHHFRHSVVVTAAGGTKGSVDLGYGHDALADEESFPVAFRVD
jgi:hypothetical protein